MSTKAPCGPEIICPAFATFTDAYLAILGRVTGSHQYEIGSANTAVAQNFVKPGCMTSRVGRSYDDDLHWRACRLPVRRGATSCPLQERPDSGRASWLAPC